MLFQLSSHSREGSTFWPCRGKSQYALYKIGQRVLPYLVSSVPVRPAVWSPRPQHFQELIRSSFSCLPLPVPCLSPFISKSWDPTVRRDSWPERLWWLANKPRSVLCLFLSLSLSSGGWASVCLCVQGFDTAIQALWLPWCCLPYKGNRVKEQWVGCSHSTQTTRNVLPHTRLTPQGITIGTLSMHLRMVKTS